MQKKSAYIWFGGSGRRSEWYSNDLLRCADVMDEAYPLQEALKSLSEFNSDAMDKASTITKGFESRVRIRFGHNKRKRQFKGAGSELSTH